MKYRNRAPQKDRPIHRLILDDDGIQILPSSSTAQEIPPNMRNFVFTKDNVILIVSAEQEISREHFFPPSNQVPWLIAINDDKLVIRAIHLKDVNDKHRVLQSGNAIYIIDTDIVLRMLSIAQ